MRNVLIVGGGPAGMMAGYLFARAGLSVTVMEKHGDFLRDFRGDTVHPSTMEILHELGLLERFLARPFSRIDRAEIDYNGQLLHVGDLSHLHMAAPYIAMMPQWEFLDFLRDEGEKLPGFRAELNARVDGFEERGGRVAGVRMADGTVRMADRLVIACDGRTSLARGMLAVESLGAPIDVFWFAIPKPDRGTALRGIVQGRQLIVMIDRGDYWQCAFVLAKGGADIIRAQGLAAFRESLRAAVPGLSGLDDALPDWDAIKLLSVSLDRMTAWSRPGLLAIGDAAHAMSPVGGIGINLAIQDAVAAANILAGPLMRGEAADPLLHKVQERRMLPTRLIQSGQRAIHERVLKPMLDGAFDVSRPPFVLRLLNRCAVLRRIPGYLIGHGIRQEHVRAPDAGGGAT